MPAKIEWKIRKSVSFCHNFISFCHYFASNVSFSCFDRAKIVRINIKNGVIRYKDGVIRYNVDNMRITRCVSLFQLR